MAALHIKPKRRGIGLTSLIDVVFILLLFFMLTSSFSHRQQLSLATPVASTAANSEAPQRVGLTANAELQLWGNNQTLTDKALLNTFELDKPLLISARENTSVQSIVTTLIRLNSLGFSQVSIGPLWLNEAL